MHVYRYHATAYWTVRTILQLVLRSALGNVYVHSSAARSELTIVGAAEKKAGTHRNIFVSQYRDCNIDHIQGTLLS